MRTIGEHAARAPEVDGAVIALGAAPFKPGGALRVLRGSRAPDGVIAKLAGYFRDPRVALRPGDTIEVVA